MFLRVWFILLLVGFFALWARTRIDDQKMTRTQVVFVILASLAGTWATMSAVWEG